MMFFGLALLIAARPDLDNPGCHRDGWYFVRGICEGISLLFFFYMLFEEIFHIIRLIVNIAISVCWCLLHKMRFFSSSFSRKYFRNLSNYLQLCAIILAFLIIPFRAATTWCASTGDGYCVDPTLLQSAAIASNFTLDINQACITASHIQWIVASLAYMVNAILVMEFLALFR